MPISPETILKRQKKLAQALLEAGLDGLVLNPGPSLTYLTGLHFHLSERPVVAFFSPTEPPALVLPELESAKVEGLGYDLQPFTYSEKPEEWAAIFKQGAQAARLRGDNVGVEDRRLRLLELRLLQTALPESRFVNAVDTMAKLRMYKDESEIASMQKAVDIAQKAMEAALPIIKIGMTEKEVAAELVLQIFRRGSGVELPFQPIIATGPNSANPHAFPTERKLAKGDLLVIDWGANVDGYFSDLTRTFGVGEVNAGQEKIHSTVRDANTAARETAKTGVTCGEVDKSAREVIEKVGYGEYFVHRTGHGLGMEGHEEPYIRAGNPMPLEPGMTFTIEPGIYVPGENGVRVEDDMVVTEESLLSLSDMPRGLRIVG